jgi:ethanolamine-phosphate cytidylyltransferase
MNLFLSSNNLSNERKLTTKHSTIIYMDGVFDIIHSGHFNAIRQSKKLGDILIVGVNSDSDVEKSKGPTLMNIKERSALVRACKWIDEVLEDTPYTPTVKFLKDIGADFCAHGDDMPINDQGVGCYDEIKNAGMLKVFKRTEGISTTDIIGRLLTCSTSSKKYSIETNPITSRDLVKQVNEENFQMAPIMSNFLSTSWRIAEFCNNRVPKITDRVIYIDGSFDILHIGHIETLRQAKQLGDFLYVGVHDDTTINKYRGKNYPILNLQERTFNLLALKYVDEVIIGAPWIITEDLIKSLNIDLIVQGTDNKYDEDYYKLSDNLEDPYIIPKKLGIYTEIVSSYDLTNELLVKRVLKKRDVYLNKYRKKSIKEIEYYQNKKDYLEEI